MNLKSLSIVNQMCIGIGVCFALSSISLLSEGFGHLLFFLPISIMSFLVGFTQNEKVAKIFLILGISISIIWLIYSLDSCYSMANHCD